MFETFQENYTQWRSWCAFSANEPNSIEQQLLSILFADMEYRTLLAARNLGNTALANPLIRSSLDKGYIARQALGIRRLTETNSKNPLKGVISLKRLANEIRQNKALFTRQNFVCLDSVSYDPPCSSDAGNGMEAGYITPGSPMDKWLKAFSRHKRFDIVSGKHQHQRQPEDVIDEKLLDMIDALLGDKRIKEFCNQANKFIAHSADPFSRQNLEWVPISLNSISAIHKLLVQAESLLVDVLLFPEIARDTTIRLEHFNVIGALAPDNPEVRSSLYTEWDLLAKERNEWRIKPEDSLEMRNQPLE